MRKRLVHVLVDVQSIEEDGCIFVRHQVVGEAVLGNDLSLDQIRVLFVAVDDLKDPFSVVMRVQDLVEPRISLRFIEKLGQFLDGNLFGGRDLAEEIVNVRSWTQ